MEALYEYTIYADLALLAILIALYLFAVTIYKGASELCVQEKDRASRERKDVIERRKEELIRNLSNADSDNFIKKTQVELNRFDDELRSIARQVQKVAKKASWLNIRYLVFIPGTLLIISLVLSAIATIASGPVQPIMWALSLLLMIISIYFLCRCLCAIDYFSNTMDVQTIIEQALDSHENKKRPTIGIFIWGTPIEIRRGEERELKFSIFLTQGSHASGVNVRFCVTEELKILKEKKMAKREFDYKNMRKPWEFWRSIGNVIPNADYQISLQLRAPEEPGDYTMAHWLQWEGYNAKEETFTIKVI